MWKTDSSYENTEKIFLDFNKTINTFIYNNGHFYLGINDGLYVSSTEEDGVLLNQELNNIEFLGVINNILYLSQRENSLWRTDGTLIGTYEITYENKSI